MIETITDRQIDHHVTGVLTRAAHHAGLVTNAIPTLRGFVETYGKDIQRVPPNGNVTWFTSRRSGQRYVLTYNHRDLKVDLRKKSLRGTLVYRFDNDTATEEYGLTFRAL